MPNQLFVSSDTANGGGGFSSRIGADRHVAPAYPLAIDGASIWGNADLVTPGAYTGHAWSCIGFPPVFKTGHCTDPADFPLKTNRGDFFISQPYLRLKPDGTIEGDYNGSLNNGIFSVVLLPTAPGVPQESGPSLNRTPFERE
ncbi:hypothetical protein [Cupriavidus sp. D39]|uniref:hypothetical protein n=1 Tax=Cupriavidus sp. D39 TaxID=2997877 RepID=UPI00226DA148|nr:hypothetical protein [Cupriavidus sp. D39]MCY0855012.1 hypothetical protein [Cupriavidus sp. D39]